MITETIDLAQRQEAFRCLAVLFCEPEPDLWTEERLLDRLATAVAVTAPDALRHAERLRDARPFDDMELRRTYARLFVGPGPLEAAPYGSVYLDGERRLLGPSTDRVLEVLREAGLAIDGSAFEAPDHIAVELELAQFLDWKATTAKGDARERERWLVLREQLVTELLAPWVPALAATMRAAEPGPFYASLADCLEAVLVAETVG